MIGLGCFYFDQRLLCISGFGAMICETNSISNSFTTFAIGGNNGNRYSLYPKVNGGNSWLNSTINENGTIVTYDLSYGNASYHGFNVKNEDCYKGLTSIFSVENYLRHIATHSETEITRLVNIYENNKTSLIVDMGNNVAGQVDVIGKIRLADKFMIDFYSGLFDL